jgi:phosphate starvation-inducible PhoH-like protein
MGKRQRREQVLEQPKRKFRPKFRNEGQKAAWHVWPTTDVLFLIGEAGCGKTHAAAALAISEIENGDADSIVIVRPAIEAACERLGYRPGDTDQKMGPYAIAVEREIEKICEAAFIEEMPPYEILPFAYMRGRNIERSVVIADECQNMNRDMFYMLLTRMCQGAKIILSGDPHQCDTGDSYLLTALEKLRDVEEITAINFDESDNMRHPVVRKIIKALAG